MNFSKRILSAGLVLALLGTVTLAQEMRPAHMHEGGMFGEHMLEFFADYLNLSDTQQTQIKQIFAEGKSTMKPLWEQEHQSHQAMMQLITSGNFDEAKAQTIAQQEAQVRTQMSVAHARLAAQAFQVLTAEQKTKLTQFIAKRQQRFEQHMQEHEMPPSE